VSEQKPELSSAETGSLGTLAASDATLQAAAEVEAPGIAPNQEETSPKADALMPDAHKVETRL